MQDDVGAGRQQATEPGDAERFLCAWLIAWPHVAENAPNGTARVLLGLRCRPA